MWQILGSGPMVLEPSDHPRPDLRSGLLPLIWVITGAIIACTFAGRMPSSFSIRPAQDTAWLSVRPPTTSFEISVVVHNASSQTVYTAWCGGWAERLIQGTWQKVSTPSCLSVDDKTTLPPGHSVTLALAVFGARDPATYPQLDPRMTAGVYRAVIPLWVERKGTRVSLPEPERRSSTFIVATK